MDSQQSSPSQPPVKKILVKRVKVLVKRPVPAQPAAASAPRMPTATPVPVKKVVMPAPSVPAAPAPQPAPPSGRSSRVGQVIDGIRVKALSLDLPDDILAAVEQYKKIPQKFLALYMYARIYAERCAAKDGYVFPPMLIEMPEDTLDMKELIEEIDENFFDAILSDLIELAPFITGMKRVVSTNAPLEQLVQTELDRLENKEMTTADQIILAYLSLLVDMSKVSAKMKMREVDDEISDIVEDIEDIDEEEKDIKERIVAAIERKHFPVDAKKLVNNYFNLARKDSDKAYETLITNPLFFSPIQLERMPKKFFGLVKPSPKDAMEVNKQLAAFLKKLKI